MIDIEVLGKKLEECCDFIRKNLTLDNLALVYEVAVRRYGSPVVSAASTILFAISKEVEHG